MSLHSAEGRTQEDIRKWYQMRAGIGDLFQRTPKGALMAGQTCDLFECGHRHVADAGGARIASYSRRSGENTIVASATVCMEVFSTLILKPRGKSLDTLAL